MGKITYLKATNVRGLRDGLGNGDVELRFDTDEKIILFLGGNGMGKSTLMKLLNPMFDKSLHIEGEPAMEELHYVNSIGEKYIIEHSLTPKGKVSSTLKKLFNDNLTVISDTGSVTAFNTAIEEELGFTKEFLNIGYIGSDVSGFIDTKASDRKKFVGKFIDKLDVYNDIYKNASRAMASLKKDISAIRTNISSIQDIDKTTERLNNLAIEIKQLNSDVNAIHVAHTLCKNIITEIKTKYKITTLEELQEYKVFSQNDLLKLISRNTELDNSIVLINGVIEGLNIKLQDFISTQNSTHTDYALAMQKVATITNDITKINRELDEFDNQVKNLENYKDLAIKANEKLTSLQLDPIFTEIDKLREIYQTPGMLIDDLSLLNDVVNDQNFFHNTWKKSFDGVIKVKINEILKRYTPHMDALHNFVNNSTAGVKTTIEQKTVDVANRIQCKTDLTNKLFYLQGKLPTLESLKHRPAKCTIDDCPFIAEAVANKEVPSLIIETKTQIDSDSDFIAEANAQLEQLNNIQWLMVNILELRKLMINSVIPQLSQVKFVKSAQIFDALIDTYKTDKSWLLNFTEISSHILNSEHEYAYDFVAMRNKYNAIGIAISTAKDDYNKYNSLLLAANIDMGVRDKINNRMIEANDTLTVATKSMLQLKDNYDNITQLVNSTKATIIEENNKLKLLNSEKTINTNKLSDVEVILGNIDGDIAKFSQNSSLLSEHAAKYKETKALSNVLTEEHDKLKEVVWSYKSLSTRLANNEDEFTKLSKLVESVHPTSGIPLVYINHFMNKPRKITNELLKLATSHNFQIDFIVNEEGFNIPVSKNGIPSKDILEISSGQRGIVKMALAMSLVSAFVGEYDVLNLDELDSFLDAKNRYYFLEILRQQIKFLNIEQVFIISHNDQFFSCDEKLGVILFPDHTAPLNDAGFMSRTKIIHNFTKK